MRFVLVLLALSLTPGCSPKGPAEPDGPIDGGTAQALAEADFLRETAREPMPPLPSGVTVAIQCCAQLNPVDAPVVASVDLLLPQSTDALAASRPQLTLGGYSIDLARVPHVLRRPDFPAVRRRAPAAARDGLTAYALAHAKLLGLARYQDWQSAELRYSTLLQEHSQPSDDGKKVWSVYFSGKSEERMDSMEIVVDVDGRAVIRIHAGAEHTELPL